MMLPVAAMGSVSVNVVPFPGMLVTRTVAPSESRIPFTIDSPSPLPRPSLLVVKNGSKMSGTLSVAIPSHTS
jgi:hypothetical protein